MHCHQATALLYHWLLQLGKGTRHEYTAVEEEKSVKIEKCGLSVVEDSPYFAGTPDRLVGEDNIRYPKTCCLFLYKRIWDCPTIKQNFFLERNILPKIYQLPWYVLQMEAKFCLTVGKVSIQIEGFPYARLS